MAALLLQGDTGLGVGLRLRCVGLLQSGTLRSQLSVLLSPLGPLWRQTPASQAISTRRMAPQHTFSLGGTVTSECRGPDNFQYLTGWSYTDTNMIFLLENCHFLLKNFETPFEFNCCASHQPYTRRRPVPGGLQPQPLRHVSPAERRLRLQRRPPPLLLALQEGLCRLPLPQPHLLHQGLVSRHESTHLLAQLGVGGVRCPQAAVWKGLAQKCGVCVWPCATTLHLPRCMRLGDKG